MQFCSVNNPFLLLPQWDGCLLSWTRRTLRRCFPHEDLFYNHGWNDMVVSLVSLRLLACNVFLPCCSQTVLVFAFFWILSKSQPLCKWVCFVFFPPFNLRGIESGLFFWFTVSTESSWFCSRLFMLWKFQVKVMNCFLSSRHLSCCTFSKRITKNSDFSPKC